MDQKSKESPQIPLRIQALPRDHAGRPVPWFVSWHDGQPDFRVVDAEKLALAYHRHRCWICGQPLGVYKAFVIGPMCALNRTSSEPPSHRDCAQFAVRACPFLATPQMHRRTRDLPEGYCEPAGIGLARNPGVALIWITRSFWRFFAGNGYLFQVGPPEAIEWYAEGREATTEEILHSIQTGLPTIQKAAEEEGPRAVKAFQKAQRELLALLPHNAPAEL